MNRTRTLAAWAVLVAVLLPGELLAGERRDVLANGGFEEGLRHWIPAAGHAVDARSGAAFAGQNCLTGEVTELARLYRLC